MSMPMVLKVNGASDNEILLKIYQHKEHVKLEDALQNAVKQRTSVYFCRKAVTCLLPLVCVFSVVIIHK